MIRPQRSKSKPNVGIVHIGPGAFHRAHQAVFTHKAMQKHGGDWGIAGVSVHSTDVRDALAPQDFVYTLALQRAEPTCEMIESICEILVAPEDPQAVLKLLAAPTTHIISMTITEKGYVLTDQVWADLQRPDAPKTAMGFVLFGLVQRCKSGAGPVTVLSCDNVAGNGDACRDAVLRLSRAYDNALADWIAQNVQFPNTMVDAITPATTDATRAQVKQLTDCDDQLPVQREPFAQWVIEDFDGPRPDWLDVGVTFTTDAKPFEHAKLRLLNGPHSALAYMGLARGHETVAQAIADGQLKTFLARLTEEEIIPALHAPEGLDLLDYRDAILDRFRNQAIRHELAQIAQDGSQKLAIRIVAPIAENLRAGRPVKCLAAVLLAWFDYVSQSGAALIDPQRDALIEAGWSSSWAPEQKALALWQQFSPCFAPAQREPFLAEIMGAAA